MRSHVSACTFSLRRFFQALGLVGILAVLAPYARATQVTWTLHNVTFNDGGTASGSFVYNADTNTYSSVNIVTSGGSITGSTYISPFPTSAILAPSKTAIYASTLSTVTVPTSSPFLGLFFVSALTDAGGTVNISALEEGTCNSNCSESRVGFSGSVSAASPATITTPTSGTVPTGTIEEPLSATGGSGTYTWTLVSGSLPPGVVLSTNVPSYFPTNDQAALQGVATTPGTYNFTLNLSDGTTNTSQAFTLTITSLNIKDLSQLPDAFAGSAYSYSLTALNPANGGAGVQFSAANPSSLPTGLTISSAGVISGTPSAQGQYSFAVTLTDGTNTVTRGYTIDVAGVQITTNGQLPNATSGAAYSQALTLSGGSGTNSFSVSGSLPSGLTLSSAGTISGTVLSYAASGPYSFQVTAANSGGSYQKWFSIDVVPSTGPGLPELSVPRIGDLTVGDATGIVLNPCCGGVAPFTWSATGLPSGMSVRFGSGVTSSNVAPGNVEIWGVPQAAGNYTIALTLTDNNGNSTSQNIPLHVSNLDVFSPLPSGLVNTAYSQTIVVLGGTGPYSATLVGSSSPVNAALPDGISIQSGAVLSGTPLVNGTFTPIFQLSDSSSTANTLTRPNTLTIANVNGGITVYSPSANLGTFNLGLNYTTFFGAFGASSIVWSVAAGSLPPGMALSSSGKFSGQFTTAGAYSFLVKAADQAGVAAAGYAFTTVTVTPVTFSTAFSLPFGNVGTAYSQTLTANGGSGALTWALNANSFLPPGLTLSTSGVLSGTPTSAGQYSFGITVTDASGNPASQTFNVLIYPAGGGPPIVTTSATTVTLTTGTQQYALGANGGTGTYTWTLTSGTLPPGLAIRTDVPGYFFSNQQAGLIGVATTPGTYNFTLTCTSGSQSVPQAFTVKITALNFKDLTNLPDDFASQPYSYTFTALNPANGGANVMFSVATNSSLPPGLTLSSSGVLSGTNGVPNNYSFQITLTDGVDTVTQSFNLLSSEVQVVSNAVMPNGTQGAAYNQTILSNGGTGPYTYQISGGGLPPGLTLTNGGNISGTISSTATTGPYAFGMTTLDSLGDSYTLQMSLDVLAAGETLPSIGLGEVDDLTVGDASSFNIPPCCGGAAPFTWSVTGLPTGMSARFGSGTTSSNVGAGNVEIWGVPQTAGSYNVTLTMTDHNGLATSQTFPLNVSVLDGPGQLGGGVVGTAFNAPIRILGGTGPYTSSLVSGILPAGIALNTGGSSGSSVSVEGGSFTTNGIAGISLTGTPQAAGNFSGLMKTLDANEEKLQRLVSEYMVAGGGTGCSPAAPTILDSEVIDNEEVGTPVQSPEVDSHFVGSFFGGAWSAQPSGAVISLVPGAGSEPPGDIAFSGGNPATIRGTSSAAGVYEVVLKAQVPPNGCPAYLQLVFQITALTVQGETIAAAVGSPVNSQLQASEAGSSGSSTESVSLSSQTQASATNSTTFTWALAPNNYLPPGLSLSGSGAIGGTPTSVGQYQFNVTATDGSGNSGTGTITINVDPAAGLPITITSPVNTTITTGTQQLPLSSQGGDGTFAWSLLSGTLPTGLAIRTDVPPSFDPTTQQAGLLGVATTPGTYNYTLQVSSASQTQTLAFTAKVTALNFKDVNNLPDSFAGSAYSYTFTALNPANAGAGVVFSVAAGSSLPAGLSLSSSGVLAGTPTAPGQYNFGLTLTDGVDTIQQNFNLLVSAVQITTGGMLPNGTQGAAYSQTVAASGGVSPYTFHIQNGQLPSGLSLSSSGAITGTINAGPGTYNFGVRVMDSGSNSYSKQMSLDVLGTPATLPGIPGASFNDPTVGDATSIVIGICCGGTAPFGWSATGLPAGMSVRTGSGVTSSGVFPGQAELWGVPQAAGNYTVQLTATDTNGIATSQSFTLHVSRLDEQPYLPGGTLNTAYSQTLRVLGGTGPYTASLVSGKLPDGLTLDADPSVSGTPLENGNFNPTFQFSDAASPANTLLRGEGFNVGNGGIGINNNSNLGTAELNQTYSFQLNACCVAAYTFSLSSGALPTGITLSSSGLLSGTPTASGLFTFLIEAADQANVANPGFEQFTLTVTPISITTNGLPYGTVGTAYSQTFAANGGSGTLTWALTAGNYLPPGLSLSTSGAITGTPTSEGQYNFNVTVTDGSGNTQTRFYNITIYAAGGGPAPSINGPYSFTLSMGTEQYGLGASGGNGTYTWSLVSGTLPAGLALRTDTPSFFSSSQQAGLIGVATTPGTYNFTLQVSSGGQTQSQAFTAKITALNFKDNYSLPDAFAGSAYSYTLTALNAANGGASVAFSVAPGNSLPAGLSLSSSGVLSGTPSAAGQYNLQIALTDGVDNIQRNFSLNVSAVQITTGGMLPNGTQNASYNQTLAASGGSGGYTFHIQNGQLPFGLSLSTSGAIAGTINAGPGTYDFSVNVTDSSNNSYSKWMSLDVLGNPAALPEIPNPSFNDPTVGDPTSIGIGTCCGGAEPFAWSATGLPTGMSVRTGGGVTSSYVVPGSAELWGVPQAAGNYAVQLTATDANGVATSQSFNLHVSALDQQPGLPGGNLNTAYSQTLRMLGGTGPYTASLAGGSLPDGLTLNTTTLVVGGTPLSNGNFGPTFQFGDSASPANTLLRVEGMNIGNGGGIGINNNSNLGTITLNQPYSNQLNACCVAAYTWSLSSGALPSGITLSSSGLLSGTPTASGIFTFLIEAADQANVANPGFTQFTLTVTPISITTNGLPYGNVNAAYNQTFAATGGTGTLTWALSANNYLPPGLSLSTSGAISGTPTSEGQYFFNVTVTDAASNTATRGYDVNIYAAGGGPAPSVSGPYSFTLSMGTEQYGLGASGGNGTYTWSLVSGTLPAGLALRTDTPSFFNSSEQAGLIGVATTPGTYNFTLQVSSGGQTQSQAFTAKITALNFKDPFQLPDSFVGSSYSYAFTALNPANSGAGVGFTVSNGSSLPAGLSLSSSGVLSGTPTSSGNDNFSITLTDGVDTISRNFNLNVSAVQITTAGQLPNGIQGVAYSQNITATGGSGGYTFSAFGGIPFGFTLSSGGTLSGTTTNNSGTFNFQIQVRDSNGDSYTKNMSLDIIGTTPQLAEISVPFVNDGVIGDAGSFSVGACCGGTAPFTWSVSGLPSGMSFRTGSGVTSSYVSPGNVEIWGAPQAAGSYNVQLTLTDANSNTTAQSFAFKVSNLDQNPQLTNGTLGAAYSQALRVLGGTGPYTATLAGGKLPDGLALTSGGTQVTGTPLENGGFGPVLRFTDSASPPNVLMRSNGFVVNNPASVNPSININNNSNLGTIVAGSSYSQQLNACCVSAYTWSVAGGALPAGITLSSGGLLSGTPTAAGTYLFLVEAADQAAVANPGYEQFTLIVTPITITTNGFPFGNVGTAYSQTLAATGGTAPLTWSLNPVAGNNASPNQYLPPGLTLTTAGVLSGTPTSAGQYNFWVTVTDANNNTNTRNYDLDIYVAGGGPPPSISTGSNLTLSTGIQQFGLSASGGNGTYSWSLVSGSLPPGLALRTDVPSFFSSNQQAGLIGVATTPGSYNFTLQVSSASQTASQSFSAKITALNIKDYNTLPDSFVGSGYSYTFTALNPANAGASVGFSVSPGSSLPAGLTLSSSGVLSGTPSAAGQYNFGVNLTDGVDTIRENFNLKVAAVQITTTAPLPNGTQNIAYNQTLAASGGSGTYTFSITSGSLPAGLSMNSSGKISGTITAGAGYYYFTVTAADTSSNSYGKNMAIGVIGSTPALPEISLGEVDDLTVGNSSSFSIGPCCGGTPPYTWSVSGLPTGMSARFGSGSTTSYINPGNVEMWGVPQAAGNYTVQLTLTDANSISTVQSFPLHVSPLNQNPNLPNGTINTAYTQPLRILGGTGPYSAALVGGALPDGLSINNTTGMVAGTPLENGGFNPILNFTDSASPANTLRRTNGMNFGNGGGISINNSANLGTTTLGSSYSNTLSACCVSAYTWSVVSGTLPTGIALSSSGVLSGTPTAAGSYTFLVKAADQANVASPGFRQFTLTVTPLTITTNGLPIGNLTVAYSQTLAATGGTGGLNWSLNANNYLPPGLSLSSSGVVGGTPTSEGQYFFNVTVTDANNNTATRGFDVSIYAAGGGPPITVTASATTTQPMGVIQFALGASGGTGTYTWALTTGSLPPGLALRTDVPSTFSASQQAGLIGIPTATGTYSFTLTVTSGTQSTPQAFTMKITALNLKDLATLPQGYVGAAYSYTFAALNPAASPTFTHNTLPAGLSLSSSGALTGTPSAAGNFHFTVTVNDGTDSITRSFTLLISPLQITTPTALPNATQNAAYNQTLAASGGTGGYSYTIESGSLPPGLSLSSGGTISGTVFLGSQSTPGLYTFDVGVFDSSNNFDSQWMSIDVIGDPPLQPSISTYTPGGFIVGSSGSATIRTCCGGTAPFTWNVTGLPTGMSFRYGAANTSSAVAPGYVEIWGVPQAAGDYTLQFTVTDANGATATVSMPLHVSTILQTPTLPNGTLGTPYSASLRVIGGTGPYTATLLERSLPDGLTLNTATMTVSGTPLENGSFSPFFQFNDSTSPTSNYAYGGDNFTIENSSSTGLFLYGPTNLVAQVGVPYTQDLVDNECCANYVIAAVVSGSLPPGISLDSYGVLSGTPTASGTYQFLVKGTDPSGTDAPGYQQFTVLVTPFATTSQTLPNGNVGTAYSQTLPATGGTAPLAWALGLGYVLPPGLSLSSSGLVSGTPADSGQYVFIATVTDANSNTASLAFTINIYPAGSGPPFVNTTPATATYSMGTLQLPLSASGGTGTYTWSLVSGNLPPGLAIRTDVPASFASDEQAGLIGVATTPGTYNFTLNVASGGQNVSQAFSLKITALNFKDARIPDLFVGVPYSYTMTAVGNAAPVTFQYVTGGDANLDPLNLTSGGTLYGTLEPGSAGVYNLVLSLTDGTDTVYCNCTLNVYAVNITQGLLPNGTQNAAYNQTITAGGGTGGYTFSLASGQLPSGLTLSSGGAITGTINDQPGRFAFSITATDSSGNSYTKPMALDVLGATPALTEITVGAVNNADSLGGSPSLGQYAAGPNGEIDLGEIDDAVIGDSYSASAGTCCGGVAPFTWTASGLPAGMSVRSGSGVTLPYVTPGDVEIWGVPQAAGSYTVQLTATDATGLATTLSFPFHVSVLDRNPAAPNGTIGTPYSATLRVLGGTGPYSFAPEAGFVPDGINQTGALQIGGTPLENGTFNPLILYTDSATPPNTLLRTDSFTIDNLSGPAITIDTDFKILAVTGKAFSQQLTACCVAAYTWSLAGGSLPTGLTLSSSGLLSGTTTAAGSYEFLVEAADQAGAAHPGYRQFQLIVHSIAITTASPLPAATQGVAYSQALAATGGTGTLTWSVLGAGDGPYLPAGLSLSSSGVLSGTPTTAGQYSFIAVVTDTSGNSGRSQVTIQISPAGGVTTPTAALGTSAILVGSASGTSSVVLSDGGAWTAVSNSSFLHVSGGSASGAGNSLVVFTYDAFTGTGTRTGTLTVAGLTLTVTQVGTNYLPPGPVTTLVSSGLNGPAGVAVDRSGNVYFADQGNSAVKEWSAATQQVTTLVSTGLNNPKGVAVDSLGNVYIVDAHNTAVKEWNATTHLVTTLVSSGLSNPIGVAVDGAGNVYISDKGNDTIQEWSASTQQVTTLVSAGLSNPQLLAVDADGNVYFADNGNNTVKEWSAFTQQVTTLVSTGLSSPAGVAVDGSGNVYFTDSGNLNIKEWSAATQQVTTLASGLSGPAGVAVDGSGNVYFADSGANVVKEIPNAYVGPAAGITEGSAAGADSLLPVIPLNQSLTGVFAPSSDQSWLTVTGVSAGTVFFNFNANTTGSPLVAHITVLGQKITVTQNAAALLSQTINFGPLTNVTILAAPFTIGATATSGLTVSFLDQTPGVCSLTGTTVSVVALGTCTIQASQGGGSGYAPASNVSQSFQVTLASQTINWTALAPSVALSASPVTLSATASSGLTVTFASNSLSVCTVSGSSVTLLTTGSCSLTASQTGNADYSAAGQVTQSFTVTSGATLTISGQVTLSSSGLSGVTITLSGSSSAVATTDSNGDYSFTGLTSGGNYAVTPSLTGDAFTPQTSTFNNLSASQTANFTATAASGNIFPTSTSTGSGAAANLNAAPTTLTAAASFSVPVSITLGSGVNVTALTFGVQITPNGSAPNLAGTLKFATAPSIVDFPTSSAGGTANSLGVVWSSFTNALTGGTTLLGTVSGSIPAGAQVGQTYTITVTGVSATTGGGAETPVPISLGANGAITVAYTYLTGDVAPYNSDIAPNFGDGVLDIRDLIQELFAVNNIPGFKPASCSDRFDAMDLYPADTSTARGGDGSLDIRDLILELFRVNNLDNSRPIRASRGGVCAAAGVASDAAEPGRLDAASRPERASDGALSLGAAESTGAGTARVPVYLTASRNLANIALTFAAGDLESQLHFVSVPAAAPALVQEGQTGAVAVVWQSGISVPAGQRLLLGYVAGPSDALPNIRIFGSSAAGADDNREIKLEGPAPSAQ
jgi:sugar lactone lactonase YvrE